MEMKRILLLLSIILAVSGCGSKSAETLLSEFKGVWKTTAPQYADRFWEIRGNEIIFGTGGESFTSHTVFRVKEVVRDGKSLYTIFYSNPEGQEYGLSFYYHPGRDGGTIKFKNQQQMEWTRESISRIEAR